MFDASTDGGRKWLLALGALLLVLSGYRWGVAACAWVSPVPFLLVMRHANNWRVRSLTFAVVTAASIVLVGKIITPPVPYVLAIPFALPAALSTCLLLWLSEWFRRQLGELPGVVAYALLSTLGETTSYNSAPLGTWSALAISQVDSLALLQLASLGGAGLIALLMSFTAASIASVAAAPQDVNARRLSVGMAAVLLVAFTWGAVRTYRTQGAPTVVAAAVVTDVAPSTVGLPESAAQQANADSLFQRSEIAAQRGARLVAWNEAAVIVSESAEHDLLKRGQAFAALHGVDFVMAYAVVKQENPVLYDNQYAWISDSGEVIERYRKHHPVPGEPSLRGEMPLVAHTRPWGRAAGAICYDYDFPEMGRSHARLGAGLVVVPSSDWRGIDPYHTQITRLRAIESGVSVLRPTRWAMSAAYDALGRTRAAMMVGESTDNIMLATIPVTPLGTPYSKWGEVPLIIVTAAGLLVLLGQVVFRRKAHI